MPFLKECVGLLTTPMMLALWLMLASAVVGWRGRKRVAIGLLAASLVVVYGASAGAVGDWLSIDRDTVVSGGVSGINGKEAALVYVKPSKGWKKTMTETAILEASDGQPLERD